MGEKLKHHTLDLLARAMSLFKRRIGCCPGLFKGDIDSAFRRVPVKPAHRWACGIAFRVQEQ
eukprot:6715668-Karenia_brevis.AAC.1